MSNFLSESQVSELQSFADASGSELYVSHNFSLTFRPDEAHTRSSDKPITAPYSLVIGRSANLFYTTQELVEHARRVLGKSMAPHHTEQADAS